MNRTLCIAAAAAAFLLCHSARSQEAEPSAPPRQEAAAPPSDKTLLELFNLGGWTMYPLLIASVAGVGLAVYNGINLRREKFLPAEPLESVRDSLRRLDIAEAARICVEHPSPATVVIKAGLDRIVDEEIDIESVEKGMEEASTGEIAGHLVPINFISVVAVISPMIGLLGTVSGMIKAFSNMATGGMGRPELLANNISEALITTASGLIVGIPVMIIYFYYKNRFTGVIAQLNKTCGEIVEIVKLAARGHFQELHTGDSALPTEPDGGDGESKDASLLDPSEVRLEPGTAAG